MTTELIQWEYKSDTFNIRREIDLLNNYGAKGWELCAFNEIHDDFGVGIFKRPIIQSPDKQKP